VFLKKLIELGLKIEIRKIFIIIKIRGLGSSKYDADEYTVVSIYILNKDGVILITRELYIVNNLSAKIFIGVDIIKSKDIILNTRKNLIIITLYGNLKIPVSIIIKGTRTDAIVINKSR
jgi:hypothetical protein